jgi:hypothetical protein
MIQNGFPASGKDLCKGLLSLICQQRYIAHNNTNSQLSLIIQSVNRDGDSDVQTCLVTSLSAKTYNGWIQDQLIAFPSLLNSYTPSSVYSLSSNVWKGYQVKGSISNFDTTYQTNLQNNFVTFIDQYETLACEYKGYAINFILPWLVLAGIGLSLLLCVFFYYKGREFCGNFGARCRYCDPCYYCRRKQDHYQLQDRHIGTDVMVSMQESSKVQIETSQHLQMQVEEKWHNHEAISM